MRARAAAAVVAVALIAMGCANTISGAPDRERPPADPRAMEEAASAQSPMVGLTAPDFVLPDQDEKPVALKDLRGKWVVLYFYPKDDTPGCTCQATEFTDLLWRYREMNAVILGVSRDSPAMHRRFTDKYDLALTLLSDPDRSVMEPYGAWAQVKVGEDKTYGRVIRSTVLIDPEGVIKYHWPEVIPIGHAERVRLKLAVLEARQPETE